MQRTYEKDDCFMSRWRRVRCLHECVCLCICLLLIFAHFFLRGFVLVCEFSSILSFSDFVSVSVSVYVAMWLCLCLYLHSSMLASVHAACIPTSMLASLRACCVCMRPCVRVRVHAYMYVQAGSSTPTSTRALQPGVPSTNTAVRLRAEMKEDTVQVNLGMKRMEGEDTEYGRSGDER